MSPGLRPMALDKDVIVSEHLAEDTEGQHPDAGIEAQRITSAEREQAWV